MAALSALLAQTGVLRARSVEVPFHMAIAFGDQLMPAPDGHFSHVQTCCVTATDPTHYDTRASNSRTDESSSQELYLPCTAYLKQLVAAAGERSPGWVRILLACALPLALVAACRHFPPVFVGPRPSSLNQAQGA